MKPTVDNLVQNLIGKTAEANHPVGTYSNPEQYFEITEVHVDRGTIYVRGVNTGWFGESIVEVYGLC